MSHYEEYDDDEVTEEEEEEEEGSGSGEEESEDEEVEAAPVKRGRAKKFKDPNKPKRNMSAFFLYSQAYRSQVTQDNPEAKFGQIAKILSVQYKALPEKETKKWQQKAEKDKIRYQEEMKHYVEPPEAREAGGGKRKKQKKDPNMPKRNMSAFFLYSIEHRPRVKEENPDAKFGDIAKLISQEFKALTEKERKKYDKLAAQDKERYQSAMVTYKATN